MGTIKKNCFEENCKRQWFFKKLLLQKAARLFGEFSIHWQQKCQTVLVEANNVENKY